MKRVKRIKAQLSYDRDADAWEFTRLDIERLFRSVKDVKKYVNAHKHLKMLCEHYERVYVDR